MRRIGWFSHNKSRSKIMKKLNGVRGFAAVALLLGISVLFSCADPGTKDVPPEDKPVADRWGEWVDSSSAATLGYTVDADGLCTITVSGTAESESWDRWKATADYHYTAKTGASYTYKFEAWTESGTRNVGFQYYFDNAGEVFLNTVVPITSTRTTYTINGDKIPKGGLRILNFQCGDQLGTFYVKILEIKEVSPTGGGGQIPSEYQGTYNVYGYHRHFDEPNVIMLWADLTDPSFDSLKANYPTICVLNSNSISMTGGGYTGQPFPASTSGSTLYVTMGDSEITMGTFNSDGFRLTYGLQFASQGAYLLYKK
jgi:hypothetical protein